MSRLDVIVTVHENTRYKMNIAILDNAHLKMQTLCYFVLKSDLPNEIKSHLFKIMQFCFLHAVLLFLILITSAEI